jgi:hypothetical protein
MRKAKTPVIPITKGSGITAGLELHLQAGKFVLADKSPDNRFAADVATWNKPAQSNKKVPVSDN